MPQGEDSLMQRDQQPTLPAAQHHVLTDPKLKDLQRGDDTMLALSESANSRRRLPIPHSNPLPQRTASNFLAASPEI
jgi:hypothetical protein